MKRISFDLHPNPFTGELMYNPQKLSGFRTP